MLRHPCHSGTKTAARKSDVRSRLRRVVAPALAIMGGLSLLESCSAPLQTGASAPQAPAASPALGEAVQATSAAPQLDVLGPAPTESASEAAPSVRFELVANTSLLKAGATLWLAARLTPPPGTHIYWRNPGESGLATQVSFEAPPAIKLSPAQYPGPVRFKSERGSTSYGYAGGTGVLVQVTLPENFEAPLLLTARGSWLSCAKVCSRESAAAQLLLSPANPSPIATPPNSEQSTLQALIRRLPTAQHDVHARLLPGGRLQFIAPETTELLEYFPLAALGPDDRDAKQELRSPSELWVLPQRKLALTQHEGLLRALRNGKEVYLKVATLAPASPRPAASHAAPRPKTN